jgi:hypothetical protein
MMLGMLFLICLVLLLFLMLFCVIYSCIFGVQRLVELIQRKWKRYLFIFGVAMIFFLQGMAFVIIPQVMVNKEKYNSNRDIFDHIDFFFEDHTKYAFSYSEENFNKIKVGTSQEQVIELLGEPLKKLDNHWFYPQSFLQSDQCYWSRGVVFDSDKKVKSVFKFYNWD